MTEGEPQSKDPGGQGEQRHSSGLRTIVDFFDSIRNPHWLDRRAYESEEQPNGSPSPRDRILERTEAMMGGVIDSVGRFFEFVPPRDPEQTEETTGPDR